MKLASPAFKKRLLFLLRSILITVSLSGITSLHAREVPRQEQEVVTPMAQGLQAGNSQSSSLNHLNESQTPSVPSQPELLTPAELDTDDIFSEEPVETVEVERFEVVGSTIFSQEEFDEILEPYTNRPLSFHELLQARSAVTDYYVQRGYVTSGAIIPVQDFEGGVIQIQVIEGTVEDIVVNVEGRLSSAYVRQRLEQATQNPLNINRLQTALQGLQLDPKIRNLSAELSAGLQPGFSLLTVNVVIADTFAANFLVDNGRSPSVGSVRQRISVEEANLFGIGDRAFASYTNTEGSNAFDLSYSFVLNAQDGTLRLAYGQSDSEIIEKPFTPLDIQSELRYVKLSYRQPVILTPTQELAIGITASRQNSSSFLLGERFTLSPGADEDGRTRISALRFFQEWTRRSENQVIAARSQFSLGVDWFDATVNEYEPDSRFLAWRGQGQWVKLLAEDTLFLVRSDLQLASQALVPLEQFSLGGIESVRGYRQDLLLGDNGWLASAEFRLPILRVEDWDGLLQVVPFFDFGMVWNNQCNGRELPQPDPNVLAGIGLGLRWQTGDNLTARLEYGFPLVSVESRGDSLQENGLYFSVIYTPF